MQSTRLSIPSINTQFLLRYLYWQQGLKHHRAHSAHTDTLYLLKFNDCILRKLRFGLSSVECTIERR